MLCPDLLALRVNHSHSAHRYDIALPGASQLLFYSSNKNRGAGYGHLIRATSTSAEMETGYITTRQQFSCPDSKYKPRCKHVTLNHNKHDEQVETEVSTSTEVPHSFTTDLNLKTTNSTRSVTLK